MCAGGELILGHLAEVNAFAEPSRKRIGRRWLRAELPALRPIESVAASPGCGFQSCPPIVASKSAQRRFHQHASIAHIRHAAFEEIGFAHEIGDETRMRRAIDLSGLADLSNVPAFHDGQTVGDRKGLLLIVRHVNRSQLRFLADAADFRAHLESAAWCRDSRAAHRGANNAANDERTRQGHALLLAAGELIDLPFTEPPIFTESSACRTRCAISGEGTRRSSSPKATFFDTLRCGQSA
jgi:hypothetical protein